MQAAHHAHSHMQKGLETAANSDTIKGGGEGKGRLPFPLRLYLNQHKFLRGECCSCSSLGRGTTKPETFADLFFSKGTMSSPLLQQTTPPCNLYLPVFTPDVH